MVTLYGFSNCNFLTLIKFQTSILVQYSEGLIYTMQVPMAANFHILFFCLIQTVQLWNCIDIFSYSVQFLSCTQNSGICLMIQAWRSFGFPHPPPNSSPEIDCLVTILSELTNWSRNVWIHQSEIKRLLDDLHRVLLRKEINQVIYPFKVDLIRFKTVPLSVEQF